MKNYVFFSLLIIASCGGGGGGTGARVLPECGPYPEQSTSPYVLPYEPGSSYQVSQGNCSTLSHSAARRSLHAYDFSMPIGTIVIASRGGTVTRVTDHFRDNTSGYNSGEAGEENVIYINHGDGTVATYVHLAENGAMVMEGQSVSQGDVVALSGNSGHFSNLPHLHFEVTDAGTNQTVPVTFLNTRPHPEGLVVLRYYEAF